MFIKPKKFLQIFIILSFIFFYAPVLDAQTQEERGASLTIYPQTGAYAIGSTFEVSVFLNTGGNYVDVIEVDLKFDQNILQVVSPTKEFSIVSNWTSPPSFSNDEGLVVLRGRFRDKGINVSEGLVSIVVFRAKSAGEATMKFLDSSKIISVGKEAKNILTSVNMAKYDVFPAPQKGPQVFSNTHPDQNKWYKNNSPNVFWKKMGKTEGFSYGLDNNPYGEPDNIVDTVSDSKSFEGVESGMWYFHLKAKEGGFFGGTSHFEINIDNIPPLPFEPYPEIFGATADKYLLIHFGTIDLLSGIDHFEARIEDRSNPKNILYSGFTQTESPFRLKIEKKGIFKVVIKAYDKAGNYEDGEIIVRMLNSNLGIITSGILLVGKFFPWWLMGLFLIIVLLIIGVIIFWRIRIKNTNHNE